MTLTFAWVWWIAGMIIGGFAGVAVHDHFYGCALFNSLLALCAFGKSIIHEYGAYQ